MQTNKSLFNFVKIMKNSGTCFSISEKQWKKTVNEKFTESVTKAT